METISYNVLPMIVLSVNAITTFSYYIIYSHEQLKNSFFKLPILIQKMYVGLFVLPLFTAPFLKQYKFYEDSTVLIVFGSIISVFGFGFIILSFARIGTIPSIKEKGGLATAGVYGIVRHPIYAGTIIVQLGLSVLNQSLITLIYLPISIALYFYMTVIEEKDLLKIYGNEYTQYRLKIKKRILPFIL